MFETAELGHSVDKETFNTEVPKLREALLNAQFDLLEAKRFPVVILIGGVDGAGKGETVNVLNEWMDPRHIVTHAFAEPSDEERERPPMWRFWRALPPKGKIGILFGSWYSAPVVERVNGQMKKGELDHVLERIGHFERMLTDDGALLLKFWFHLSKKAQKKRLSDLEDDDLTRYRVTKRDWKRFEQYDEFRSVAEKVLRETSTGSAPWSIVEGVDERYRSLTVGKAILDALTARLAETAPVEEKRTKAPKKTDRASKAPEQPAFGKKDILGELDLSKSIDKDSYEKKLERCQRDLNLLSRDDRFKNHAVVLAYEGSDAAGKGGNIRRVTAALDARRYEVHPVAAPTEDERAQPYLWRFWRDVPRLGQFSIFDRTWYGRVLVERVEGFAPEADWQRAYGEINDFEEQLDENRTIVIKLWLQISKDEQEARFSAREKTGFKRYKITEEDWRNRKKWDAYQLAVNDMVERTSTDIAPCSFARPCRSRRAGRRPTSCDCASPPP